MVRKTENYLRYRQLPPERFDPNTFKTVPLSHTKYKGGKFDKPGAKAIVGKLRKTGEWAIQSIIIPRKKKHEREEMPIGPYKNFDACERAQRKKGRSKSSAKKICGKLYQQTHKKERLAKKKLLEEEIEELGTIIENIKKEMGLEWDE